MYRKLVKLNPNNGWRFCEVDPICLKREVLALKDYLENRMEDDAYGARKSAIDLCDEILNSRICLPAKLGTIGGWGYPCREGWLPDEFCRLFGRVELAATGTPLDPVEEITIDGEVFGYMDFEEPGDWPDKVKYP